MLTLLPFPSAFYSGNPCKNHWNRTAGSTAQNFSKGYLLYAKFSELKQLCYYLQSCIIHDFDIFIFFEKQPAKLAIFSFFKVSLFPTGWWSQKDESLRVLKDLSRLSNFSSQNCQIYCLFVCLFIFRFLGYKYRFNIKKCNIRHVK